MDHLAKSALITVDVQNDFVLPGAPSEIPGTMQVVPNIVRLAECFRAFRKPVIHMVRLYLPDGSNAERCRQELIRSGTKIVAPGTEGSELVGNLLPNASIRLDSESLLKGEIQKIGPYDLVIYKPRWGAFYRTPLEDFLRKNVIDSLFLRTLSATDPDKIREMARRREVCLQIGSKNPSYPPKIPRLKNRVK